MVWPLALLAVTQAGLEGMSAYFTAEGLKASGRYQSHIDSWNAEQQRKMARQSIATGARRSASLLAHGERLVGAQEAAQAAGGLQVDVGSAADLRAETERLTAFDALEIRKAAYLEAWGYETQAIQYDAAAHHARTSGSNQGRAAYLGGSINVIQGALGNIYNMSQFAPSGPGGGSPGTGPTYPNAGAYANDPMTRSPS